MWLTSRWLGGWVDVATVDKVYPMDAFGAKGDGTRDDTEALQTAIDTAWNDGGGTVKLAAKRYAIAGNIELPTGSTDTTDRYLAIVGQGPNIGGEPKTARRRYGSRLLFSKADGSDCIAALSGGGTWPKYRFENFSIEGPDSDSTATSGNGIRVTGGSSANVTIRDVEVTHFRGGAGFRLGTVLGGLIDSASAQYCKYGFYCDATFNGNVFIRPLTQACTTAGVYMIDSGSVTFVGGIIQSSLKTGIYLEAVSGVRFLNTYFENNNSSITAGEYAFKVDAPSSGRGSAHIKLDGCRFSDDRDVVYLSGVAGGTINSTIIEGGYNSSVTDPKIIINNAFVVDTRIIEAAGQVNITDNGSRTFVVYNSQSFHTDLLSTKASNTTNAGLRIPHGSAPTSPVNGDMWTTTAGLFVRINGVTKTATLT